MLLRQQLHLETQFSKFSQKNETNIAAKNIRQIPTKKQRNRVIGPAADVHNVA